jgi:hypothetical protein
VARNSQVDLIPRASPPTRQRLEHLLREFLPTLTVCQLCAVCIKVFSRIERNLNLVFARPSFTHQLLERLLALREFCTRLAAPDEDVAAAAAASGQGTTLRGLPSLRCCGLAGGLDPRPPSVAACRREFEVAGWDALVHRAWCRASAVVRRAGTVDTVGDAPGQPEVQAAARVGGTEGWLWVFEDAWVFRPAA